MQTKKPVPEEVQLEWQRKQEEERQKLVVLKMKLPNGATYTKLRPALAG